MPVDTTKQPPPPPPLKRQPRKVTEEEQKDIELKRLRGEISCAECRRLKLKCDKKVPCASCVRRGCESICPLGVLSAGQGTRFILADTAQLHHKIAQMSLRIRQLEEALEILQDGHPLLSEDLLRIKFGSEILNAPHQNVEPAVQTIVEESVDALGTLTLNEEGEIKYFGRSGGLETLLMAGEEYETTPAIEEEEDDEPLSDSPRTVLSPELRKLADQFPFTPKQKRNPLPINALLSHLPPQHQGMAYARTFVELGSLFFRPMKDSELLTKFLPSIYNAANARAAQGTQSAASTPGTMYYGSPSDSPSQHASTSAATHVDPHALATLFFIMAIGTLLDTNQPAYSDLAESFYDLGRSALSLRAVFHSPQLSTIQAVALMSTYHSLGPKKYSRDSVWCLMSLAAKLAQSLGLHRDGSRWRFAPEMIQRRRELFWEVFSAEISHCLALGRPPSIHLSYVDCEFPTDEEATASPTGDPEYGFWRLKYAFAKSLYMDVAHIVLSAQPPTYAAILDLDRKVRQLPFPEAFKPKSSDPAEMAKERANPGYHSGRPAMMEFYASQFRTVTLLYLHRSFFAQAMLSHPQNPLLSPFAPSVLTSYRCSSVIIKAAVREYDRAPELTTRAWFLLQHMFSAAIIVGSVVARTPSSNMAPAALEELLLAADVLDKGALHSQRAKVAVGVLRRLEGKAKEAWNAYHSGDPPSPNHSSSATHRDFAHPSGEDEFEDALAMFGGQARLLPRKPKKSVDSSESATDSPTSTTSIELSPMPKKASSSQLKASPSVSNAPIPSTSAPSSSAAVPPNSPPPPLTAADFVSPSPSTPASQSVGQAPPQPDVPPHLLPYYSALSQPTISQVAAQSPLAFLRGDMGTSVASMYSSIVGDLAASGYAKLIQNDPHPPSNPPPASTITLSTPPSSFATTSSQPNSYSSAPSEAARHIDTRGPVPRPQLNPCTTYPEPTERTPTEPTPTTIVMSGWPENYPRSITLAVPPHPAYRNEASASASNSRPQPTNASHASRQRSHPYPDPRTRLNSTSPSQHQSHKPPHSASHQRPGSVHHEPARPVPHERSTYPVAGPSTTSTSSSLSHAFQLPATSSSSSSADVDMLDDAPTPFQDDDLMVPMSPERQEHAQLDTNSGAPHRQQVGLTHVQPGSYDSFPAFNGSMHHSGPHPSGEEIDMGLGTGTGIDQGWFSFVGQSGLWVPGGGSSLNGANGFGGGGVNGSQRRM